MNEITNTTMIALAILATIGAVSIAIFITVVVHHWLQQGLIAKYRGLVKQIEDTSHDMIQILNKDDEQTADTTNTLPLHVYDWLDQPSENTQEKQAKEWLEVFCLPAIEKHTAENQAKLTASTVKVMWKGEEWTCCGASRMGDVWLNHKGLNQQYIHRVGVESLSNWTIKATS